MTQMVDPLNFRFMDARLKNVASLRRRRDAARSSSFSPSLPRSLPFLFDAVLPIDASVRPYTGLDGRVMSEI